MLDMLTSCVCTNSRRGFSFCVLFLSLFSFDLALSESACIFFASADTFAVCSSSGSGAIFSRGASSSSFAPSACILYRPCVSVDGAMMQAVHTET